MKPGVTVSIVSHGHSAFLPDLLGDLAACPEVTAVILTYNIPEQNFPFAYPNHLTVINNSVPKGFGANHNAAFAHAQTPFFLVLNPDVRLVGNPFKKLLACLDNENVALCSPAVINTDGLLEDNARQFPSLGSLAGKAMGRDSSRLNYKEGDPQLLTPWVAGVFMLFRSEDYRASKGFDEGFFLYYEDVDFCARLWLASRQVMLCPSVHVVHDARRSSRNNPRYMFWHALSMMRYFRKQVFRPKLHKMQSGMLNCPSSGKTTTTNY